MSSSTIKLYSSANTEAGAWKLLPNKLFKIDNISDYLAQFTPLTINDHNYVKNALEVSIKVTMTQDKSQPNATTGYKYVSIQNTSENICYYFVKKAVWLSAGAVRFDLVMDVLNTFNDGTHYVFKPNTRILREHKDRFTFTKEILVVIDYTGGTLIGTIDEGDQVTLYNDRAEEMFTGVVDRVDIDLIGIYIDNPTKESDYRAMIEPYLGTIMEVNKDGANYILFTPDTQQDFSFTTNIKYYRNIDPVAENINPLLQNGNANGIKLENPKTLLAQDWYLLYRNQNDPSESLVNPVECYLIPQNETKIDSAYITGGRLIPSWLEDGKWYVFSLGRGEGCILATLSNGVVTDNDQYSAGVFQLLVTKAGGKINAMYIWGNSTAQRWGVTWQYDDLDFVTFSSVPVTYRKYDTLPELNLSWATSYHNDSSFDDSGSDSVIDGVDKVDRTDSKNIKLIKLPYCPYNFTINSDKLHTNGNLDWDYAEVTQSGGGKLLCLKLKKMSTKLHTDITWLSGDYRPFMPLHVTMSSPSDTQLRQSMDDSKIYHSEFYKPTYYYDSFSFAIQLEKCVVASYHDITEYNYLKLRFDVTSTINSRFMFTFNNYYINYGEQNYAKNLIIVRNNEEVLYNVAFINYVRTGYNFDQKAKTLTNIANWTGVGLGAVSIGASLLAPSVPLKVAGVVGAVVSMATSIKSAVSTSIQSEQTLQNKILQTQNQTSSVAGSDDVDLMSVYAENRLKYLIYQPMPNMKNLLNDLFFYAGYNSGRMGLPDHNTRVNFDYLECDAVLESAGANLPQEIIDEIKNCYKVGVTFIHKTSRTTDKWDIEQKYENWENSILEA